MNIRGLQRYELRLADKIARMVSKEYNMISSGKFGCLNNAKKFDDAVTRLYDNKIHPTRISMIEILQNRNLAPEEKIQSILNTVKKSNYGNCAEMTEIAMILAKRYGIKDFCMGEISNKSNECMDHVFVYVKNNGKPYIIDPFFGFADYLDKAMVRFRTDYKKFLPFEKASSQDFKIMPRDPKWNDLINALNEVPKHKLYQMV